MTRRLNATQARQGQRLGIVSKVLAISLSLGAVAFVVVYFSFF